MQTRTVSLVPPSLPQHLTSVSKVWIRSSWIMMMALGRGFRCYILCCLTVVKLSLTPCRCLHKAGAIVSIQCWFFWVCPPTWLYLMRLAVDLESHKQTVHILHCWVFFSSSSKSSKPQHFFLGILRKRPLDLFQSVLPGSYMFFLDFPAL